jgi:hypothetical protein
VNLTDEFARMVRDGEVTAADLKCIVAAALRLEQETGRRDMVSTRRGPAVRPVTIKSTGGQNKPVGGASGAGGARGGANLATTAKTTPGNVTRKSK